MKDPTLAFFLGMVAGVASLIVSMIIVAWIDFRKTPIVRQPIGRGAATRRTIDILATEESTR